MADSSVQERTRLVILDELDVDENDIQLNAHFVDDLGADSLDIVELVLRFEEEFSIEIPDDDAEKLVTVGAAVDYLNRHVR